MAETMNYRMNLVIDPKNVIKANRELRAMERYFERIQGRVLRIGRTRMAPEIVLKDRASKGLENLLRKLQRVRSEVVNASGTVTLKIQGGKVKVGPDASLLVSTITSNTVAINKLTAALGATKAGDGKKEDPKGFLDQLKEIFGDLKKIGGGLKTAGEIPGKFKELKDIWNDAEDEGGGSGGSTAKGKKNKKNKKGSKTKKGNKKTPKRNKLDKAANPKKSGSKMGKATNPKTFGSKLFKTAEKGGDLWKTAKSAAGDVIGGAKGLWNHGKDLLKGTGISSKLSSWMSSAAGKMKNSSLGGKASKVFKGGAGKLFSALGFGSSKGAKNKPRKLNIFGSKLGEWTKKGAKILGPVTDSVVGGAKGLWDNGKQLLKSGGGSAAKAVSFVGSTAGKIGKSGLGMASKVLKGGASKLLNLFSPDPKPKKANTANKTNKAKPSTNKAKAANAKKGAGFGTKLFKMAGKSGELLETVGSAGEDIIGGAQGLWKHGKELLSSTGIGSKISSVVSKVGKSGFGSAAGKLLAGGAKKLMGPLGFVSDAMSIASAKPGKERSKAIGSTIGSAAGTMIGGALGTLIPIPGVGNAIGATLGNMAGGFVGEKIGGLVADYAPKIKETFSSVKGWFSKKFGGKSKPKDNPAIIGPPVPAGPKVPVTNADYSAGVAAAPGPRLQTAATGGTAGAAAGGKLPQVVQISPEQMTTLSGFLRDMKTESTTQYNLPPGAVQVTVHEEYPVDVEGLIQQIGQRLRAEFQKASQNKKPVPFAQA